MYKPLSGYDANTLKLLKVILSFVRELESDPGAGASMLGSHTFRYVQIKHLDLERVTEHLNCTRYTVTDDALIYNLVVPTACRTRVAVELSQGEQQYKATLRVVPAVAFADRDEVYLI